MAVKSFLQFYNCLIINNITFEEFQIFKYLCCFYNKYINLIGL